MANFAVANTTSPAGTAQLALGTSYAFLLLVNASTGTTNTFANPQALKRGKLYDILVGTNATPADNYVEYEVTRCTVTATALLAGSVSSLSSQYMLDVADAPFGSAVTMNGSAGSSTVCVRNAQLWYVGVNQRASYRWVAAPGSEMVYPAISSAGGGNNGLGLHSRSGAYTGTCTGTIMVSEQ